MSQRLFFFRFINSNNEVAFRPLATDRCMGGSVCGLNSESSGFVIFFAPVNHDPTDLLAVTWLNQTIFTPGVYSQVFYFPGKAFGRHTVHPVITCNMKSSQII